MPVRLLFVNTRDECGADVSVHLSMMSNFLAAEADVFVISNSEARDADEMRERLSLIPRVTSVFMPLGEPAEVLARRNPAARLLSYLRSARSLLKAARFVREHRIEVLHATDRPRDASFVGALGRLTGRVSVVHMHAPATEISRPSLWGMHRASAIFSVSNAVRSDLIAAGIAALKIHTLYNAVDVDHFDPDRPARPARSLRSEFGIPTGSPLIGIAARMNPWKGQTEVIGAVSLLRDTFPDLHLIVVGADVPEMRARFEQQARAGGVARQVHFAGFRQDVRPFLRELDLFVHPSHREPFGLAIAEAMAMRKAVVACGTGGVPEIITHGLDGWLVEEGSASAVATAIRHLLADRDLCRGIGERARETIRARFTPRRQCVAAAALYGKLLAAA